MTLPVIIVVALVVMALAACFLRERAHPLAARIDAVLPQTQCRQCGHDGCRPYAEAIATGEAIDRCPPGGAAVIRKLAALTGRPVVPLDTSRGVHEPRQVAFVDEARCIGCTLCIQACPVDAIVGAPKLMHTVIAADCTGCELCLPPCPVDCIVLKPQPWRPADLIPGHARSDADRARGRFEQRAVRLERERRSHAERMAARAARKPDTLRADVDGPEARKRAIIAAALERARTKLAELR
ncbi:MAG: electron transport complex subunit RsxB [Betaproteobacteria bacterium]|nr:electron transport complex subunit RsxB [Betaproteobacteria bacterium]